MLHALSLSLQGATFHVSAAGNAQVRKQGVKNIHARIHGQLTTLPRIISVMYATYNPYKHTNFVCAATGEELHNRYWDYVRCSVVEGKPLVEICWA